MHDGYGGKMPVNTIMTTSELKTRRALLVALLTELQKPPTEEDVLDELAEIDFLLGDDDGNS